MALVYNGVMASPYGKGVLGGSGGPSSDTPGSAKVCIPGESGNPMRLFTDLQQSYCLQQWRSRSDCTFNLDTDRYTYEYEDCPCTCVDGVPQADVGALGDCATKTVTDKLTGIQYVYGD